MLKSIMIIVTQLQCYSIMLSSSERIMAYIPMEAETSGWLYVYSYRYLTPYPRNIIWPNSLRSCILKSHLHLGNV